VRSGSGVTYEYLDLDKYNVGVASAKDCKYQVKDGVDMIGGGKRFVVSNQETYEL